MQLQSTTKININLSGTNPLDLSTPQDPFSLVSSKSMANGTGSGKNNQSFHDNRSLATGVSEELDLSGGLTDAFGVSILFTKIKGIFVRNNSPKADGNTLLVGGSVANGFIDIFDNATDKLRVRAQTRVLIETDDVGYAVTAATADLLQFEHDADGANPLNALTYDIVLWGEV